MPTMNKANSKFGILKEIIMERSNSKIYEEAIAEWIILFMVDNDKPCVTCLCTQEGLRYEYHLLNIENGNTLDPVGSVCIKRFGNENLNTSMTLLAKLDKVFKCKGSIHSGKTFREIIVSYGGYVDFLKARVSSPKKQYKELMKLFDLVTDDKFKHLIGK